MNKVVKKEMMFNGKKFVLETGKYAFQANMNVKASYGDTVVLVSATMGGFNPDIDFFPLTVNYQEKLYASGSIKTSRFVKRENYSTDEAIITQRLADHAIRPLFPTDFRNEVQIAALVLSLDSEVSPEFVFMNAVAACLHASDIPWEGPMATYRVGYVDNNYVLEPSTEALKEKSDLDLVVSFAGFDKRFLALEAEANNLPEEKVMGAIDYARNNMDELLKFIDDFAKEVNPSLTKATYVSQKLSDDLLKDVKAILKDRMDSLMREGLNKDDMKDKLKLLFEEVAVGLEGKYKKLDMQKAFDYVEKTALQNLILDEKKRPDGRAIDEIRELKAEVGVLPRTHGSGLFSRGITQALTIATLGAPSMEMIVQDMYGEETKRYMHFYNMPPYASGETGRIGGAPKNREIGHGMLAEKALRPVLPSKEEFPYTTVLVTEILSSSGSTSMAATCGSTLALMDAGVPIKDMVAGVGVGLIVNDDMTKYLVMTDLAYLEDAYGFMDFKMTGTKTGVTAIQCDIKAKGLPIDIIPKVIEQSKEARLKVLAAMEKAITTPRTEVSEYAPKMVTTKISPDEIGTVIGAGGKNIKQLQERTGAEISIEQDGTVVASSLDKAKAEAAIEYINNMFREVLPGEVLEGTVEEIVDFGAFVELFPGKTGLLHVSEVADGFVKNVSDYLEVGQKVTVKVVNVDRMTGKMSLSIKALNPNAPEQDDRSQGRPDNRDRDNRGRDSRPRGGDHGGRRNRF